MAMTEEQKRDRKLAESVMRARRRNMPIAYPMTHNSDHDEMLAQEYYRTRRHQ